MLSAKPYDHICWAAVTLVVIVTLTICTGCKDKLIECWARRFIRFFFDCDKHFTDFQQAASSRSTSNGEGGQISTGWWLRLGSLGLLIIINPMNILVLSVLLGLLCYLLLKKQKKIKSVSLIEHNYFHSSGCFGWKVWIETCSRWHWKLSRVVISSEYIYNALTQSSACTRICAIFGFIFSAPQRFTVGTIF